MSRRVVSCRAMVSRGSVRVWVGRWNGKGRDGRIGKQEMGAMFHLCLDKECCGGGV